MTGSNTTILDANEDLMAEVYDVIRKVTMKNTPMHSTNLVNESLTKSSSVSVEPIKGKPKTASNTVDPNDHNELNLIKADIKKGLQI